MTHVLLDKLTKTYPGATEPVVKGMHLEVPSGKLVAFLGPSGSGKTTTLKMIAGLIEPTSGDIRFDGQCVLPIPTEKRGAVMVFQNYLLFPYMNIGDNVGFGLKMRGVDEQTIKRRVGEMLELVKLPGIEKRRPRQLSGGQQQRVALARALITDPRVLLLDEPLSNLDAHLRDEMRDLILNIQRELGVTTIFVTHDQEEAVLLAEKIALMFDGLIQDYAPSERFYKRPTSKRAARFFGGVNFLPATRHGDRIETPVGGFTFSAPDRHEAPEGEVTLTIRPEHLLLNKDFDYNCIGGTVEQRVYVGTYTRYKIRMGSYVIEVTRSDEFSDSVQEGEFVSVHFLPDRIWLVPREDM